MTATRAPVVPTRRFSMTTYLAFGFMLLVFVMAVIGPLIVPESWLAQDLRLRNSPPSSASMSLWLGTDSLGRSLLGRIIIGTRTTMVIAIGVLVVSTAFGGALGVFSGGASRRVDDLVMRVVDIATSFPALLLAIVFLYVFGSSQYGVIIVLALTRWPVFARLARAETLRVREYEFVKAYRVLGYSRLRVALEGFIPNVAQPIVVLAILTLGQTILAESALSFLGIGVQAPEVSWGLLVAEGRSYFRSAWWIIVFPGLMILATVLSATYLSDYAHHRAKNSNLTPGEIHV